MMKRIAGRATAAMLGIGCCGMALADVVIDPDGLGLTAVYPSTLGSGVGTSSYVTVDYLYVGHSGGDGSLEINADNVLDTVNVLMDSQIGASLTSGNGAGSLRVIGDGTAGSARLLVDDGLAVGIGGNGRIDILDGGQVSAAKVQLGSSSTVDADILVSGTDSRLESTAGNIAFSGTASAATRSLTVEAGAWIRASGVYDGIATPGAAYAPGDIALQEGDRLTVTGSGSVAFFEVNVNNRGIIEVFDGAALVQDEPPGVIDTFSPIDPRGVMSMRIGSANGTARLHVANMSDVDVTRSVRIGGYKEFVDLVPDGAGGYQWIWTGASGEAIVENSAYLFVQGDLIVSEKASNLDIAAGDVLLAPGEGRLTVRNGGQVYVGGSLIVNEGGQVDGDGVLDATVVLDGGAIAPGNSPGVLTIMGDLEILGGTIDIEIGYSGQDILDVWGNVNILGDATVNLRFVEGYAPVQGEEILFLGGLGGLSGTGNLNYVLFGLEAGFQYRIDAAGGTLALTALNDAVSAVPVPPALWLFGSGLLLLVGRVRFRCG